MDNLKPFDPDDIEESLLRLVAYDGRHYALFPYIDVTGSAPEYKSVRHPIARESISAAELGALSAQVKQLGKDAEWHISFSTPWRIKPSDGEAIRQRSHNRARKQ